MRLAKEIARKLVAWADVVADSHRPGVLESWGLGYDELKQDQAGYHHDSKLQSGPDRAFGDSARTGKPY